MCVTFYRMKRKKTAENSRKLMNYLANSSVAFVLRRYLRSLMFFLRRHYIHQWAVERVYRVLKTMNQSRVATKKKSNLYVYISVRARYICIYMYTYTHIYFFLALHISYSSSGLFARPTLRAACGIFVVFLA